MAGLVRELGYLEQVFHNYLRYNSMSIVNTVILSSTKKVEDSVMEKAMRIMGKIFPPLRIRVVDVEGSQWFQEIGTDVVDFKRVNDDWRNFSDDLLTLGFDESGPLWRVRLVELEQNENDSLMKYKYAISFHWAHLMTDGITNMKLCGRFAEVIDAILNNRVVDWHLYEEKPAVESVFDKNYTWSEIQPLVAKFLKIRKTEPIPTAWSKTFPENAEPEVMQMAYFGKLEVNETRDLIARCKIEGVTVNGALSAAFNLAMYNEIRRGGMQENTVSISSFHNVDLRRFLEDGDDFCGFLVGAVLVSFELSDFTANQFWDHAREVSESVHAEFQKEEFLKSISTVNTLMYDEHTESSLKEKPLLCTDYCSSNVGVIDKYFSENSESSVQVECVSRSLTTRYLYGGPLSVNVTTFRGHFYVNVDYLSRYISRERAHKIATEFIAILKRVVRPSSE